MSWKNKILIISGVIIFIISLLFVIKYQRDIIERQKTLESSINEQKQLSNSVVMAQNSFATKKDIESIIKESGLSIEEIRKELDRHGADVKGVSVVKVISIPTTASEQKSTDIVKGNDKPIDVNNPDPFGYWKNKQEYVLNEYFENQPVPFGKVGFSSWKDKPWSHEIYKREYVVTNVVGTDEDGKNYVFNKFSVKTQDKVYDVKIQQAKFEQIFPESKFRVSPRLFLGIDGGAYLNKISGEALIKGQVFLFSYGKTKPDPDWIFVGLGGGYAAIGQNFNFAITPLSYNVGHHIPLTNNIFLGPTFSIDFLSNYAILGGISVGL